MANRTHSTLDNVKLGSNKALSGFGIHMWTNRLFQRPKISMMTMLVMMRMINHIAIITHYMLLYTKLFEGLEHKHCIDKQGDSDSPQM